MELRRQYGGNVKELRWQYEGNTTEICFLYIAIMFPSRFRFTKLQQKFGGIVSVIFDG
jgi:hypothetical protein